jgi:thioredoxin 1
MKNIYYFTADWCAPCKRTKPIVEELRREQTKVGFQIIDADFELDLVKMFNIQSIPTFILLQDGIEIKREIGGKTKEQLLELINYEKTIQEDL